MNGTGDSHDDGFPGRNVEEEWGGCLIDDGKAIRNWGIRNSTLKVFGIGGS